MEVDVVDPLHGDHTPFGDHAGAIDDSVVGDDGKWVKFHSMYLSPSQTAHTTARIAHNLKNFHFDRVAVRIRDPGPRR